MAKLKVNITTDKRNISINTRKEMSEIFFKHMLDTGVITQGEYKMLKVSKQKQVIANRVNTVIEASVNKRISAPLTRRVSNLMTKRFAHG